MADLTVYQPPLVDARGDINFHGRAGFLIEVSIDGEADISARSLVFEVDGVLSLALSPGATPDLRTLVVRDDEAARMAAAGPRAFLLADRSAALAASAPLWSGCAKPYGFKAAAGGVAGGGPVGAASPGSARVVINATAGSARVVVRNVGMQGKGAVQALHDAGLIAEPTAEAMAAYLASIAAPPADQVPYDDSFTEFGVSTVQAAIEELWARLAAPQADFRFARNALYAQPE